jgi:hypothetical protein
LYYDYGGHNAISTYSYSNTHNKLICFGLSNGSVPLQEQEALADIL